MESRAAHTHPKNTQVPPPGWKSIFMNEILWLSKDDDDDDDDENKTYPFQYMSSFCILHLFLINLSVCNKLLTIENFWKKHLSVWSHAAIKINNFFQAIKFKVAPWLESLSMKVVSSFAIKDKLL